MKKSCLAMENERWQFVFREQITFKWEQEQIKHISGHIRSTEKKRKELNTIIQDIMEIVFISFAFGFYIFF